MGGTPVTPGRAYVVVGDGQGKEVASGWVHSVESDRFRARLRPSGRVEVAWVNR